MAAANVGEVFGLRDIISRLPEDGLGSGEDLTGSEGIETSVKVTVTVTPPRRKDANRRLRLADNEVRILSEPMTPPAPPSQGPGGPTSASRRTRIRLT
ncbi:hypothetical protein [Rhodococcus wratislaviensis]|uniref:hypothetical protein n=1 Tax=Rhodococcus wratislaviensis TaxID=44752 RepID=UPI00364968CE